MCNKFVMDDTTPFSTIQIKSEPITNHHSNVTATTMSTLPFDKHRISTDGISRLAIHNNNSSNTHSATNGNLIDTTLIKTEEISTNHETKIQVRDHHEFILSK